jgi:hypothetical protein
MTALRDLLHRLAVCASIGLFVSAMLVVTPESRANTDVCSKPNNVTCTANDPNNPTDCNAATDGKMCDQDDNACVCRWNGGQVTCSCGYKMN